MLYSTIPRNATLYPSSFEIVIHESRVAEMHSLVDVSKIAQPTFESTQADGKYGVTFDWIKKAKKEWQTNFDWRTCEERVNSFPNFKARLKNTDDSWLDIHFTALFSTKPNAIPILLLHGWPGSFLEFLPMLSLMRERYHESNLPYHFIVPSLPGYAFSSRPPTDKDFRIEDVAHVMNSLMIGLGFENGYVVQGGDLGSLVGRIIAKTYVQCKAVHVNFCIAKEPEVVDYNNITSVESEGLERAREFSRVGNAYALEQATKPSTIGLVLATNPLALLIWIGEKFQDWSDVTPSMHTILESVALYWLTETFPHSIYPYRQLFTPGKIQVDESHQFINDKPLGFSWFPKEIMPVPESWIRKTGNLVFYRRHSQGGHFAALEQTELLTDDLVAFIDQVWTN